MKQFIIILIMAFVSISTTFAQGVISRSAKPAKVEAAKAKVVKKKPQNTPTGFNYYLQQAQKGDMDCQFYVACCYDDGADGVKQDVAMARYWYEKAASQGHPEAQSCFGDFLYDEGNCNAALEWWAKAAQQNDISAIANIGHEFLFGGCLKVDYDEAARYLKFAADNGDPFAIYDYGYCLYYGCGVQKDVQQAQKMYNNFNEQAARYGTNAKHYSQMKAPLSSSVKSDMVSQQSHMSFLGIPLNGTLDQFHSQLINKGFTFNRGLDNFSIYRGLFMGYKSEVFIIANRQNRQVYQALVRIKVGKKEIMPLYEKIQQMLKEKYANNPGYYEGTGFAGNNNPVQFLNLKRNSQIKEFQKSNILGSIGMYSDKNVLCLQYIDSINEPDSQADL